MNEIRIKIAKAARELYSEKITFEEFMQLAPEQDVDDEINELVDLIMHEPKVGGFLGMKKKEHEEYIKYIFKIIERFESHAT